MRQSGRTRISDIATRLGVSTATVSRALTGNGYVREGLSAQIRAAAVEMGYALPGTVTGQRVLLVSSQDAMIDFQRSQFTMYVLAGLQERAAAQDIRVDAFTYQGAADLQVLRQEAEAEDVIGVLLVTVDDQALTAVHDLVSITGSLVLGLAVTAGRLDAEAAWALSRIGVNDRPSSPGTWSSACSRPRGAFAAPCDPPPSRPPRPPFSRLSCASCAGVSGFGSGADV